MPVLAVLAVMADAWSEVMPVLAVLAVMADAWSEVMPVLAVLALMADAWAVVIPVLAVLAVIEEITSSAILSSVTALSSILAVVMEPSDILPDVIPADIVPEDIVIPLPAVRASCFPSICVCIAEVTPST